MKTTEDLKAAKSTAGKGFGGQTRKQESVQSTASHTEALALANGLGGVVNQQVSELGLLAQQTDQQLGELAKPVADYFSSVADGTALVGKVLELMHENSQPASLSAEFTIDAPVLPSAPTTTATDFFSKPKPISLPGA